MNLMSGTYWVNLFNASVPSGDPVYWDENSGQGCHSTGCPSQAYESAVGTIPSESFDVAGFSNCYYNCGPPYPSCFTSGIIHDFTAGAPSGVTLDRFGNIYGTTSGDGDDGQGLVYKLQQVGGNWLYSVLYSFTGGSDGDLPGGVVVGPDGALYGTASGGVSCNYGRCGVVYRLAPPPVACRAASCSWNQTVIYSFTGNPDGVYPSGNLVFDQAGNLYGTTLLGGAYDFGTVFELTPSSGGWTEKVIYSFTGDSGFLWKPSLVLGHDGNLYGTTYGSYPNCS